MFMLRSCIKCHGDLYAEEDVHGTYLTCTQCGRDYFPEADPVQEGKEVPASLPSAGLKGNGSESRPKFVDSGNPAPVA